MCSVDSGEKTDFTDLSPATPSTSFPTTMKDNNFTAPEHNNTNFIASYPFSSNEQSQEAHRRSTKNLQDMLLGPDAQYDVIKDHNQFDSTPYEQDIQKFSFVTRPTASSPYNHHHHPQQNPRSPKNVNLTPKRQNIGANISSIIHNLSASDSHHYPDGGRMNQSSLNSSKLSNDLTDNEQ
jgi:hypothetical protein